MRKIRAQVESYLKREPRFRERGNRASGFINLLAENYPSMTKFEVDGMPVGKTFLIDICQDFYTMVRAWNKTLEENESLRGNDYDDKTKLKQEAQIELGYEAGYHNDTARRTRRKIEPIKRRALELDDSIPF